MKKEEFIIYLEGIASVLELAGLEKLEAVIEDIITEAGDIEVQPSYPHYTYPVRPYPWYNYQTPYWYNVTGSTGNTNITTTTADAASGSTNTSAWYVKNLTNGDFEIVKD